jgi:hypothetical protein
MPSCDWMGAPAVVNEKVYIFGCYAGGVTHTALEYDPSTDNWSIIAPMPTARYGLWAIIGKGPKPI